MNRFRSALTTRRACGLTVATAAAALAVITGPVGAAQAAPLRGLQIAKAGDGVAAPQLAAAKRLGAQIVRMEVTWSTLEPAAAGQQDPTTLAAVDAAVASAKAHGMKILMVVVGTPCWASTAPAALKGDCSGRPTPDAVKAYPPSDPKDFAAVTRFLAGRYKASLAALELWNEPDQANEDYFAGPDKADRYVAMVKAAYPEIKKVAPAVPVLAGSIVGANGNFLRALYAAGMKGYYDGLSVHYYDLVLGSLRSIRQVQLKAGDRKPLWLAEFGWSSCAPARTQGGQLCVSKQAQGPNTVDIFRSLRHTSYVKAAVVYTLQDTAQYDFGVLDKAGHDKLAFSVIQKGWKLNRAPRPVVLNLRRSGAGAIASGTGPAGDTLELDVFQGTTLRYKASFRLDRDNRYSLKIPAAVAKRGYRVRVYQYWDGGGTTKRL